ncbi:MAG: 50S ribosomal protein L15 [Prevotellaceae bacterium]|jgi:large subunit ribosomal protein L15|nr:50S ribosomal protein L15 [Prevotellaceae bacterium]
MNLNSLKPAKGSLHRKKRIGRGQGSGHGGTSTRGHKGAKSRSGYSRKFGFEGGQMPIQRRLPKYGFTNINRVEYRPVNLDALQELAERTGRTVITLETLVDSGLVSRKDKVKILANGEFNLALEVRAHAFSKSAVAAIESKGGQAIKL